MRRKLPLISDYKEREADASKDEHIINAYLERAQGDSFDIVKRPGLTHLTSPHATYIGHGLYYDEQGQKTLYVLYDGTNWDLYQIEPDGTATKLDDIPNSTIAQDVFSHWTRAGTSSGSDLVVFGISTQGFIWNGTAVSEISDADFDGFSRGIAYLDGYVFASAGATIQNSNLNDATAWDATDTITPQTMNQNLGIVWITNHKNHVVAFGKSSIEFFYNAGNPSGSPLSPRRDILYTNIGAWDTNTTFSLATNPRKGIANIDKGERIAFVSHNKEGKIGVHLLENFELIKISNSYIDRYLNQDWETTQRNPMISSFVIDGKTFICLSVRAYNSTVEYYKSWVYDLETGLWSEWQSDSNILTGGAFEVVDSAGLVHAGGSENPLPTGSAVQMSDGEIYQMDSGAYQDTDSTSTARDITVEIVTPKYAGSDGTHGLRKFQNTLKLVCDRPSSSVNVAVSWTDDDYQNFTTAVNLDISSPANKIAGMGSFYERAYKFVHADNSSWRVKHAEADINTGLQ